MPVCFTACPVISKDIDGTGSDGEWRCFQKKLNEQVLLDSADWFH
jgi:hypothetical protein